MSYVKLRNKNILDRAILLLIVAAMMLSILSLAVAAEIDDDGIVRVDLDRFRTEEIATENFVSELNDDGTLCLTATGTQPKLSMRVTPVSAKTKANALRFVIKNTSNLDTLNFEYIYKNSAQISETGSGSVTLKKTSYAEEYIVPVAYVDSMTHMVITFSGSGNVSGNMTLVSIGAVSGFFDNREYFGTMTGNSYDDASQTATFSGTVSYETTLANPDAKIVLYKLEQNELIEDVRVAHPYVASCPMTLSFKFVFDVKNTADICSKYFAAVLTEEGEIIPLTSETYLKSKNNASGGSVESFDGFKGIETNLYAGAVENGTSVAFADIYLNRLVNSTGDGFQYILDQEKEYYFDRAYVLELDAMLRSYSQAGVSVYFRFLVDSGDSFFGYNEKMGAHDDVSYFAVNPCDDEVVENVYACADFIMSRYSSAEFSGLRGVILGRSLDEAYIYNYCGALSMAEYAEMLAHYYSIVKSVLNKTRGGFEILLPMSDSYFGSGTLMNAVTRDERYPVDLLASTLLKTLGRYGVDVSSLHFMLESDHVPLFLNDRPDGKFVGADNISVFTDMVKKLSNNYLGVSGNVFFCWLPSAKLSSYELITTYIYNYNVLASVPSVKGYVVSLFERDETVVSDTEAVVSEKNLFALLKSTYKYADTFNNPSVSSSVLAALGKNGWDEVIDGFDLDKIIKRTLVESHVDYYVPDKVVGTYCIWNFASANGLSGWSISDGCASLSVYTPSTSLDRALVAGFDGEAGAIFGADYGSVIYKAEHSLFTSSISNISFDIIIPSEISEGVVPGEMFEVRITVVSDESILESSGIVKSDTLTSVYTDITDMDKVEYIKISLRSLEGDTERDIKLCVNSVSIHSDVYNNKELENMVLSGELTGDRDVIEKEEADTLIIIGSVLGVSAFVVIACWGVFSVIAKKTKE